MSIELVRAHLADARLDDAERMLRELRGEQPDSAEVAIEYAFCAVRQERWDVALARFREAERRFGESAAIAIGTADALIGAGRLHEARMLLERAETRYPRNPWIAVVTAKCGLIAGDVSAALAQLDRTLEVCEDDEVHAAVAGLLLDRGLRAHADTIILRAQERFPHSAIVVRMSAVRSSQARRWDDALASWLRYHQAVPGSAVAVDAIAEALEHRPHDERSVVVVYGNCQAEFVCRFLAHVPALALRYAFVPVSNVVMPGAAPAAIPAAVERAVLVFEQYDRQQHVPVRDVMRERIPASAETIRFPALNLSSLWPFSWPDERISPEPGFPWGRYPWGDRLAIEISKLGLHPEKAFRRYLELTREKMPDVRALLERDLAVAEMRDAACEVKMRPYLEAHVRSSHLFWTWGHTSGAAMAELVRQLVDASREILPHAGDRDVDEQIAVASRILPGQGREQVPVHPDIIARLGLGYLTPATRYEWFGNRWTFEEYFKRYLMLDRTWDDRQAQVRPRDAMLSVPG